VGSAAAAGFLAKLDPTPTPPQVLTQINKSLGLPFADRTELRSLKSSPWLAARFIKNIGASFLRRDAARGLGRAYNLI